MFDGELIIDSYKKFTDNTVHKQLKYLIFDCMMSDSNLITEKNYLFRLKYAEAFLK